MVFSTYAGNIYKSECIGHIGIEEFVSIHQNPTEETLALLSKINEASLSNDKKQKARLKEKLKTFTPSVFVSVGDNRKYDNIVKFSGLMQLDFDGIESTDIAESLKAHLFNMNEEIICSYLSPSRLGVKALLKITVPENVDHYKAIHKAVSKRMDEYGYFDKATKNCILPLFLSADKDLYYREDAETWIEEDWNVETHKNLSDYKKHEFRGNVNDRNFQKVVRLATSQVMSINSNGHPQLRSASLIVGSRVAAGYLSLYDAENLMINLVNNSHYLAKGINGYIKTAKWGIAEGMKTPKYF